MWRLLIVILCIVLAFLFVRNRQKKNPREKTGELLEFEHVKDLYGKDILDGECMRIMRLSPENKTR
jgi:hypothetical protein